MSDALRTDLFGMPLVMHEDDLAHASKVLSTAWVLQAGSRPGSFASDLSRLADWFHPRLRGMTLRARLEELAPLDTGPGRLPATVLMPCGDERYLVTPEGRAWLACIVEARRTDGAQVIFAASQAASYEYRLLALYRDWSRHRLVDVVEKRTGEGAPMLPPAAGLVLLLLVNRSIGPDMAIRRVRNANSQAKIDDVIADILEPFSDALGGKSSRGRDRRHFSLWSGYPLTEARRRLSGRLVLDASRGSVYLAVGAEEEVLDFVSRDIARRHDVDEVKAGAAFDALVEAYRHGLEELSRLGSGFERAGRTDALRDRVVRAVREQG